MKMITRCLSYLLIVLACTGCVSKNTIQNSADYRPSQGEGSINASVNVIRPIVAADNVEFVGDNLLLIASPENVGIVQFGASGAMQFPKQNTAYAVHAGSRTLALGMPNGQIVLYDIESGKPKAGFAGNAAPQEITFSPSGNLLAVNNGGTLNIVDVALGKTVKIVHNVWPDAFAFSPDGKLAAYCPVKEAARFHPEMGVQVIDTATLEIIAEASLRGSVKEVEFSANGELLVVATKDPGGIAYGMAFETHVRVFEAKSGHQLLDWDSGEGVSALQFVGSSEKIALGTTDGGFAASGILRIMDARTGKVTARFDSEDSIRDLSLSSNGKMLAGVSGAKSMWANRSELRIYDLSTKNLLYSLPIKMFSTQCSFSEDGKYIIVGGDKSVVHLVTFPEGEKYLRELPELPDDQNSVN